MLERTNKKTRADKACLFVSDHNLVSSLLDTLLKLMPQQQGSARWYSSYALHLPLALTLSPLLRGPTAT